MPRRTDCPGNASRWIGNATAAKLFAKSPEVEMSYFWKDKDANGDCKCRPDALLDSEERLIAIDLKSTRVLFGRRSTGNRMARMSNRDADISEILLYGIRSPW